VELIVFDLSTLSFRRSADGMVYLSLPGLADVVGRRPGPDASERETVFEVLDAALGELSIPAADGTWRRPAFYNPLTAQVAVGAIPSTETFSDSAPIALDLHGTNASLRNGLLIVGTRELPPLLPDAELVRRSLMAHTP
jgi:hypothetical protein